MAIEITNTAIINAVEKLPGNQILCPIGHDDLVKQGAKYRCNKCGLLFTIPHLHQKKALNLKNRFILVIAGIQGGKSEVGAKWIRREIIKHWNDEGDYLVAAPTYKILSQSTLPKFLDEMKIFKRGKFSKQDMVYKLKNGKNVFLRSTEDPSTLEAMTLRSAWLDETGNMKKQVWINIQGRTAVVQGRVMMTTTPYPNYWWLVSEIIERWKDNDPDYEVIEFNSIENPSFPLAEYERAKRTLDPRVFKMRYEGKFVKMSGLIYPDFSTGNIKECPDTSKIITWIGGMDFGHNFCFVLIGRDKDGNYYQTDEYYTQGGLLREHAEEIKRICAGKNIFAIYADPSEPGLMQELTVLNITPIIPANNDVELGLNKMGELINSKRFMVSKKCNNTISEIGSYHRKETSDVTGETKVVKIKDHACLVGNTKVLMADRSEKRLQDIEIGDFVMTPEGANEVLNKQLTRFNADIYTLKFSNGSILEGTKDHRIFTNRGKISLDAVRYDDIIEVWKKSYLKVKNTTGTESIIAQWAEVLKGVSVCTLQYGKALMVQFPKVILSTIKTMTEQIMTCLTLNCKVGKAQIATPQGITYPTYKIQNTENETDNSWKELDPLQKYGTLQKKDESGIARMQKGKRKSDSISRVVSSAIKSLNLLYKKQGLVQTPVSQHFVVKRVLTILQRFVLSVKNLLKVINMLKQRCVHISAVASYSRKQDVYNLTVNNTHNYFANGILVANCDSTRYALLSYPDEESIMPKEDKKDWEYKSQLDMIRQRGLEAIRKKMEDRDRGEVFDEVLGYM